MKHEFKTQPFGYTKIRLNVKSDLGFMHDEISCGVAGIRYKGTTRSLFATLIGGGALGILFYWGYRAIKDHCDLNKKRAENSEKKIIAENLKEPETQNKRYENERKSDGLDEETELNIDETPDEELVSWWNNFNDNFQLDNLNLPPIIIEMCVDCPPGFEQAMIAALTTVLALCFSRVEAKYLDGTYHRPNLQTIVEGPSGSGKEKIKRCYEVLFSRRIKRDFDIVGNEKLHIIQSLPSNISQSRMIDVLAKNQNVHALIFDSEVMGLINAMKGSNGINYDLLRKAFDNGIIGRMNKDKGSPQGCFNVALNLVLTGTPGDIRRFTKEEAIEGGNASRIAWCCIPAAGRELPTFLMPEGTQLERIQDKIDEWTAKYSFDTDVNGKDVAASKFEIDLGYVNDKLQQWLDFQYDKGEAENNEERKNIRARIAAMAFHCAIVYHMLYDNPGPNCHKKREDVVNLTIYMANYFMERYLHKFGKRQNEIHALTTANELVPVSSKSIETRSDVKPTLPDDPTEKSALLYRLNTEEKLSYNKLADMFGESKDAIYSCIRRYRDKLKKEEARENS
ncbi:MAG: DUF3987 domain-containing protein [Muribaculum sp.]|nr:DUF3987 domain-containing protein [Muribaculum sp.]